MDTAKCFSFDISVQVQLHPHQDTALQILSHEKQLGCLLQDQTDTAGPEERPLQGMQCLHF